MYRLIHIMDHSAHIVKWVTENNCPISIVEDRELREILTVGRPTLDILSPNTISRNIKASFSKCWMHVMSLLQVC